MKGKKSFSVLLYCVLVFFKNDSELPKADSLIDSLYPSSQKTENKTNTPCVLVIKMSNETIAVSRQFLN